MTTSGVDVAVGKIGGAEGVGVTVNSGMTVGVAVAVGSSLNTNGR